MLIYACCSCCVCDQPLGTDYTTLRAILAACNSQLGNAHVITVGGFTPWAFKYVDAKHGGVPTEWQTAMILSQYNALLDADACCVDAMANAALYQVCAGPGCCCFCLFAVFWLHFASRHTEGK